MSGFAVVVSFDVSAADRERLQTALKAHSERCLRDEPGTLQFDVLRPEGTEDRLMIYELYTDEAAFEAHAAGDSVKTVRAETEDIESEMTLIKCTRID